MNSKVWGTSNYELHREVYYTSNSYSVPFTEDLQLEFPQYPLNARPCALICAFIVSQQHTVYKTI